MNRFTKEALKVSDLDQKVAMISFQQGTMDNNFRHSVAKRAPDNMNELHQRQESTSRQKRAWENLRKTKDQPRTIRSVKMIFNIMLITSI